MAEFCRSCYIKNFGNLVKKNDKIVESKRADICEGCGKVKPVVLKVRKKMFWEK